MLNTLLLGYEVHLRLQLPLYDNHLHHHGYVNAQSFIYKVRRVFLRFAYYLELGNSFNLYSLNKCS